VKGEDMGTENTDICYNLSEISEDQKNAIKNMGVFALPDSPAAYGMKVGAVKPKFWQPLVDGDHSLVGLINALIETLNTILGDVKEKQSLAVSGIRKTSSEGLVDTYTITFLSGETSTFTVKNGENGDAYILTEADKVEIAERVLADFPVAEGVGF
jgi:hypothetical protein